MRYFYILIIIFIFFFSYHIYASSFSLISDIGSSAQSIAMGNIEGSSRSANAIFSNPAGLYRIKSYSVSLFQTTIMNDIDYFNVSLCKSTKYGNFGLGYYSASVDNIPFTAIDNATNEFYVKEQFSYNNLVAKLSYQHQLSRRLHIGLNYTKYKLSFHNIEASGYGFDLGVLRIFKYFTFSTFIQNINKGSIAYKDLSDDSYSGSELIPLSISSSLRFIVKDFILYPQIKYHHNTYLPSLGLQYNPGFMPFLRFNTGYRHLLDYANQKHTRVSLGFDLRLLTLEFHYAYERSDYILYDHISYFSLSYDFKFKDPNIAGIAQPSSLLFFIPALYLLTL